MKNKSATTILYDPEADVLSVESTVRARIDHAEEMGDLVVHFTKANKPVLVEILGASRLFKQKGKDLGPAARKMFSAA